MPPRINGCPVSHIVSNIKMQRSGTEISNNLQSALSRIEALEEKQNQLLRINQAMFELLRDIVGGISGAPTTHSLEPGVPWSPPHSRQPSPSPSPSLSRISTPATSFSATASSVPSAIPPPGTEDDTASSVPSVSSMVEGGRGGSGQEVRRGREITRLLAIIDARSSFYNRQERPHLAESDDGVPNDFALCWHRWCSVNGEDDEHHHLPQVPVCVPPVVPIRVPEPYPSVNWNAIRPLPRPASFPMSGCPSNSDFYTKREIHMNNCQKPDCPTCVSPFGSLPGFETTRGIVAPPKDPIHGGYVYDGGHGKNTKYILLASAPG